MNLVLLNDSAFVNGGAAKVALSEAQALAAAGHQVQLVCGVGPAAPALLSTPGLTVHCLDIPDINVDPSRLRAMTQGLWNPKSYRSVRTLLAGLASQDTVVHVHSWTRALSSSAVKAALDSGAPVVVTLHDYLLACPQGTFFLQPTLQKCPLKPMSVACLATNCDAHSYANKLWRAGRKLVQTEAAGFPKRARHFIYLSKVSLGLLQPYLPADANFYNVPNPIDVDQRPPVEVAANAAFLFVGRLVPEKGGVLFARAAAAEQVPARFLGEGPQRDAIAAAYPAAVLSGWMAHADGLQAMREARALVFPSLWHESLGLTVLEAASQGLPSIVPDTCAASESVIDGVTGLHFRSGDEADLRAKIRLLTQPDVAARMGKAAYERFWSTPGWTMPEHIAQLESIYRKMLDGAQTL